MRRTRAKLEPWIENMIISHGTDKKTSTRRLKAHVVGVGQMSNSQAQGAEGPTGLLFLSDGMVQIPAILTQSAWETLMDQEDRECFASLVNSTVCMTSCRLQFYMAAEQSRCMFFLLVGELATTAAGPAKDNTPCCTTLSSVKLKICQTWRSQLDQEDSAHSQTTQQYGFDLTELLGEWQHDCVEGLLQEAGERLRMPRGRCPEDAQPSTSSCNPLPLPRYTTRTGTGWDADRVRYKGEEHFTVPVSHILIPEGDIPQTQTPVDEGSETPSGLLVPSEGRLSESPPVASLRADPAHLVNGDLSTQTDEAMIPERSTPANEDAPPQESALNEAMVSGLMGAERRDSPWDIYTPPTDLLSVSSSSNEAQTPEDLPKEQSQSLLDTSIQASTEVQPEPAALATSTQIPSQGSSVTQKSGESKGEQSSLPPYQKPRPTAPSPTDPACGPSSSVTPPGQVLGSDTETPPQGAVPVSDRGRQQAETVMEVQEVTEVVKRKCWRVKRKSSERAGAVTPSEEEDARRARSPPSWLFESQEGSRSEVVNCRRQSPPAKKTPTVHSDGTLFSYSYKLSEHTLQALSKYQVADDMLQWAVRYLVPPKQTDQTQQLVS